MESRMKLLGHPPHQMLVPLPIGLLVGSAGMDLWGWTRDDPSWTVAAHRMMGAGVLTALVAAPFGFLDWQAVPSETRARQVGAAHGAVALTAVALFALSWLLRRDHPEQPPVAARALSLAAVGFLSATAWLGGELVSRLGVGVSRRAHLNAPASLHTGFSRTGTTVRREAGAVQSQ